MELKNSKIAFRGNDDDAVDIIVEGSEPRAVTLWLRVVGMPGHFDKRHTIRNALPHIPYRVPPFYFEEFLGS